MPRPGPLHPSRLAFLGKPLLSRPCPCVHVDGCSLPTTLQPLDSGVRAGPQAMGPHRCCLSRSAGLGKVGRRTGGGSSSPPSPLRPPRYHSLGPASPHRPLRCLCSGYAPGRRAERPWGWSARTARALFVLLPTIQGPADPSRSASETLEESRQVAPAQGRWAPRAQACHPRPHSTLR